MKSPVWAKQKVVFRDERSLLRDFGVRFWCRKFLSNVDIWKVITSNLSCSFLPRSPIYAFYLVTNYLRDGHCQATMISLRQPRAFWRRCHTMFATFKIYKALSVSSGKTFWKYKVPYPFCPEVKQNWRAW